MAGRILFHGRDLVGLAERQLRHVRWRDFSVVMQSAMNALNPVLSIRAQLRDACKGHGDLSEREIEARSKEVLRLVSIDPVHLDSYPHQLSGGMRQRAMIAMALSCNPKLLIADEPTTALDVTIQAQILDLMRELQETTGTAIVLITHDMGVVAENADRVVVMYAGHKVEEASADDLFDAPLHPYTKGLLGSVPNLEVAAHLRSQRARLNEIKGIVPSLADLPQGCTFAPRCRFATEECRVVAPPLEQRRPGHWVACWHADGLDGQSA